MDTLLDRALMLPRAEQIKLICDTWDSVIGSPNLKALTSEQIAEIDHSLEEHCKNPNEDIRWEEFRMRWLRATDTYREDWLRISAQNLNAAYGDDEPEHKILNET